MYKLGLRSEKHENCYAMCFSCLRTTKLKDWLFTAYKKHSYIYSYSCPNCKHRIIYAMWDENNRIL